MRTAFPSLTPLLRSDLQAKVLGLLLLTDGRAWTASDLSRATGAPHSSVHRELIRGIDAGVLERESRSVPHRYTAAKESPLYEPLVMLLERTVGIETRLGDALASIAGVEGAFIHGSWAKGRVTPSSDVDLIVVGAPPDDQLRNAMRRVGREVGRRIDFTLLSPPEFRQMIAGGEQPLASILADGVTWLLKSGALDD